MYLFRNVILSDNNSIVSLCNIPGLSWARSTIICSRSGTNLICRFSDVNEYVFNIMATLSRRTVFSDARIKRHIKVHINKLIDYKTYRGKRHAICLPVRGQRSRTNARTQKNKRFMLKEYNTLLISKRKKVLSKKKRK